MRLIIVLMMIMFASCGVSKHIDISRKQTDSIATLTTHSVENIKIDSVVKLKSVDDYQTQIIIEYGVDTITHKPVVVKKTINKKGIKIIDKDAAISTTINKENESKNEVQISKKEIEKHKDVKRLNFSIIAIVAYLLVGLLILIKMIRK